MRFALIVSLLSIFIVHHSSGLILTKIVSVKLNVFCHIEAVSKVIFCCVKFDFALTHTFIP